MKNLIFGLGMSVVLATPAMAADIVTIASTDGRFNTLVAAVDAAGLAGTLSGGEFTVFAPTDDAFAELPSGVVDKLLMPENLGLLQELLTYHVVAGTVTSNQVVTLSQAETVSGERVKINLTDEGGVRVNNANVILVDIMADNGVIHVVDKVLLPKSFVGRLNSGR